MIFAIAPDDGSRDRRIDDPSNTWVVHLAGRLLLPAAIRLRIPANAVSIGGFLFGAGGAGAYFRWYDWRWATAGFILCLCWLIADGLDGMIARATRTASELGRFLDGLCDHLVFLLLYVLLAASLGTVEAWVLAAAAGAAHAVQATLFEGERDRFHRRARGELLLVRPGSQNPLVRVYDAVAGSLDARARVFDAALAAAPDARTLGERYGFIARPPLAMMALLSNNMRVLAIYVACLAGNPRLFWWYELVVLSPVALWGIVWHRRVEVRLAAEARGALSG